jgi:predicted amidohydrolase
MTGPIAHYRAVALQLRCDAVNACAGRDDAQRLIDAALDRALTAMRGAMGFFGRDTRLFVLPEYFLTSFPAGESAADWIAKACITIPGPETDRVSSFCAANGVWVAGNSYEADAEWPGRFFQASWIVGPEGVVLRYRRLNSLYAVSPHDMWARYRERYGLREVFPVADTPIGRLAAIASEEILYPEVARCLMMHGAEIFAHSTSDVAGHPRMPKEVAKLARAIENLAYVVSANTAGIAGIAVPEHSADGKSKIVDYKGLVLAEADQGETIVASAEIDLDALRRYRRREGMQNLIARQRFELYAPMYAAHCFCRPDQFPEPIGGRQELLDAHRRTIARLVEDGVIK